MWDRCNNPNRRDYKYYCESIIYEDFRYLSKYIEWIKSQPRFEEFCSTCHEIKWNVDKDIKVKDNKNYYPEYMTLCPKDVNLRDRASRFDYSHLEKGLIGISIKDSSIIVFNSRTEAIEAGFYIKSIYKCIQGDFKQHRGYKWYNLEIIKL